MVCTHYWTVVFHDPVFCINTDIGGEWGVRIKGKPLTEGAMPVTNLVFYAGLEGEGGIDIVSKLRDDGLRSPVKLEGDSPQLGDFAIQITDGMFILHI